MKLISRANFLGLCAAGVVAMGVGHASAQVVTPSRVGGVLATRGDGTIVIVARGTGGALNFGQRIGFGGVGWGQWDAWYGLGGVLSSTPVTLVNANGKLLILGRGTDDRLYTRQESAVGSKTFDAWYQIPAFAAGGGLVPTFTGKPALVRRSDGLLSIYSTDLGGKVWESTQLTSGGSWSDWQALGSPAGVKLRNSPVVALMNNGGFVLFSTATNNKVYARVQTAALGSWGSWTDLGGSVNPNDSVATGVNSNGRVSVIINNTADTVSWRTQTAPSANSWTSWANLPGGAHGETLPAVSNHSNGRMAVFFFANYGSNLAWQSQTAPSSTTWSNWSDVQTPVTSAPVAIRDIHGKMHLVVLGSGGFIYERVQTAVNSTTWTEWSSGYFGGPFAPF